MNSKLSVIIPVYKVEKYLRQCVDSIVKQTYQNLEIILIDDGSPDSCGSICDEYAAQDDRIIVIHKKNEGLSAARNDGINISTGEWIAFVDSDDWCDTDYYQAMMQEARSNPYDILWAGGYYEETFEGRKVYRTIDEAFDAGTDQELTRLTAKCILCGPPWDKLFHASLIHEHHLCFDTEFKANEDVWFNFMANNVAGRVGGITRIGYHYRYNPQSITRGFNPKLPEYWYHTIKCFWEYTESHHMDREIREAIHMRSIFQMSASINCCYLHPANTKSYIAILDEIKQMKQQVYYNEAIWYKSMSGLSKKQILFKLALRLPWTWPIYLLCRLNQGYKSLTSAV